MKLAIRTGRHAMRYLQERRNNRGFTMLEMLLVITMMLILVSVAIPNYRRSVQAARESVLRQNLFTLRNLIQEFTLDKKRAPFALDELVSENYLRAIPNDITGSPSTWQEETCNLLFSAEQSTTGLCDVRSGSSDVATDGTAYNAW